MKIDTESWLLASSGAGLLIAGGALLRSAFVRGRIATSSAESAGRTNLLHERLLQAESVEASLRQELAETQAERDAQRVAIVELHEREEQNRAERAAALEPSAMATLQAEVLAVGAQLKAVSDERDHARAKVEALERLVEGVRARSRELAEELRALKG